MPRLPGSRNGDYADTRRTLVDQLRRHLVSPGERDASLRDLAIAAKVSVATLLHYFGSREGILRAVLEHDGALGAPFMRKMVEAPLTPLAASVRASLEFMIAGWMQFGSGAGHVLGLAVGLGEHALGPVYLQTVLEPSLDCFERRLTRHAEAGDLRATDLRVAALALVGPVLLALLHQRDLGGHEVRLLDWSRFLDEHVRAWVAGYGHP